MALLICRGASEIAGGSMIVLGSCAVGRNLSIGFWLMQESQSSPLWHRY